MVFALRFVQFLIYTLLICDLSYRMCGTLHRETCTGYESVGHRIHYNVEALFDYPIRADVDFGVSVMTFDELDFYFALPVVVRNPICWQVHILALPPTTSPLLLCCVLPRASVQFRRLG